jgi:hypothetical protein
MMLVVEPLKILALTLESCIAWKPLPPKELTVIGVVEVFDDTVSPWLPNGDKNRCNTVVKTESDYSTKGARISVTATKAELIVKFQKVWHAYGLPASHKA